MRIPRHPTNIRRMLDSRVQQMTARKPLLAASSEEYDFRRTSATTEVIWTQRVTAGRDFPYLTFSSHLYFLGHFLLSWITW